MPAKQDVDRVARELEMSRAHLGHVIAAATADSVSLRDVAVLIDASHQSVNLMRRAAIDRASNCGRPGCARPQRPRSRPRGSRAPGSHHAITGGKRGPSPAYLDTA